MEIRTVLGKLLKGEHNGQIMNVITLVIDPRQTLTVYANELTPKQFEQLKEKAYFIVLEKRFNAQLEWVTQIIPPFDASRLANKV